MQRGHPLGMPVGLRQAGGEEQMEATLNRPVPNEAQLRLLPSPITIDVAEQLACSIVATEHAPSPHLVGANESRSPAGGEYHFQQAC